LFEAVERGTSSYGPDRWECDTERGRGGLSVDYQRGLSRPADRALLKDSGSLFCTLRGRDPETGWAEGARFLLSERSWAPKMWMLSDGVPGRGPRIGCGRRSRRGIAALPGRGAKAPRGFDGRMFLGVVHVGEAGTLAPCGDGDTWAGYRVGERVGCIRWDRRAPTGRNGLLFRRPLISRPDGRGFGREDDECVCVTAVGQYRRVE